MSKRGTLGYYQVYAPFSCRRQKSQHARPLHCRARDRGILEDQDSGILTEVIGNEITTKLYLVIR